MKKHKSFFMVGRFLNLTFISIMLTSLVLAPMVLNTPIAMAKNQNYSHNHYSQIALSSNNQGTHINLSSWNVHSGSGTTALVALASEPIVTASVSTTPVLTSVAVMSSNYTVNVGGTSQFTATPRDQNDNPFTGTVTTTFTSSNPAAAKVNSATGLVTGVSAGTSTITGTSVSGTIKVTDTAVATVTASATTPVTSTPAPATPALVNGTPVAPVTPTPVTPAHVTPTPVVPTVVPTPPVPPTPTPAPASSAIQWGAYVGDGAGAVSAFDTLVGKKSEITDDFEDFTAPFPTSLSSTVGSQGKTLVVFWEPSTGLSSISNGSLDSEIKSFAAGAKSYGYPVILVPFDEMNLNESAWGAGQNGNTPAIFIAAWKHIHDLFVGDTNVKFAITYNNVSIPSGSANDYAAYYPGANYVDIVGIDGYNFGSPWQTFDQVFSSAYTEASQFGKPIYLMAIGSAEGTQKAAWIQSLGTLSTNYPKVAGWTWFNDNKEQNWLVNSDAAALAAFKSVLP